MTSALQISKTGMLVGHEKMNALAADMANANAVAGKNTNYFTTSIPSSGGVQKGSGGVSGKLLQNIDQTGSAKGVENSLYCAAGEKGFFVVDGGFTRVGTWDFNAEGYCVNHLGKQLKVYHVNPDGERVDPKNPTNVISDKTSQTYLTGINKLVLRMDARATENINFSYQLPQEGVAGGDKITSDVTVFDSLGSVHNLKLTFTKANIGSSGIVLPVGSGSSNGDIKPTTGTASAWFLTVDSTDVGVSNTINAPYIDASAGMLIEFDSAGKPLNFGNTLAAGSTNTVQINKTPLNLNISWGNNAANSSIALNLGTIGQNDGMVARGSDSKIGNIRIDGNTDGQFSQLQWTPEGYGIVIYDNGEQEKRFQIAMAHFSNPNSLAYSADGTYAQTAESGVAFYGTPKDGVIGALTPSALEEANISEINTQVDIIGNQQYFGAQATVFRTAREMLELINTLKS